MINRKKIQSRILCFIFCFLIFGMTVWSFILPAKSFSENENRFLAQMPVLSKESLLDGTYAKEYETFITDQFPLRDAWISLKTASERAMLKQESNGVYFAKDDYLIETHAGSEVDQEQLKTNTDRLITFIKKTAQRLGNEHVRVMLVPTANTILTNKLPPFASGFDQLGYLQEIQGMLEKNHMKDTFVDISNTLQIHNQEEIFYRTDHHWTALGAYYAYEEWMKSRKLEAIKLESYHPLEVTSQFYGTIYSKVNTKVKPDSIVIYEPNEEKKYQVNYNMGERKTDTLYEMEQLEGKDKYAVFLGGNNAVVTIRSENKNGKKLLIIKDSYAHCFTPFVIDHYQETEMIDLRYFNMLVSDYIDKGGFDDVLFLYNIPNFIKDRNMSNLR